MSAWIATALVIAIAVFMGETGAHAGCTQRGSYHCIDTRSGLDLNSVPDIASQIVGQEAPGKKRDRPVTAPAAPAPYTGPIVGIAPGSGRPTVGYSWSLD
jgi:hypothetical protein